MITQQTQTTFLSLLSTTEQRPIIILGLSGGPDSIFLLHALAPLHNNGTIQIHALHINHGWRSTAHQDETFCKTLCAQLHIPFSAEQAQNWHHQVPTHKQNTGSAEADAREMRRIVFEYYRATLRAAAIVLAHHADDQIETFFIRLIRGSGLSGLCSMTPIAGHIVRPLLTIHKKEIIQWLADHAIAYCHDQTNSSNAFLRNRLRASVVPALQQCDARSPESILRTITHLQQEEAALQKITAQSIAAIMHSSSWYDREKFFTHAPALRIRILTQILITHHIATTPSEALFAEIERFLASPRGGTHTIGIAGTIIKKKNLFTLTLTREAGD